MFVGQPVAATHRREARKASRKRRTQRETNLKQIEAKKPALQPSNEAHLAEILDTPAGTFSAFVNAPPDSGIAPTPLSLAPGIDARRQRGLLRGSGAAPAADYLVPCGVVTDQLEERLSQLGGRTPVSGSSRGVGLLSADHAQRRVSGRSHKGWLKEAALPPLHAQLAAAAAGEEYVGDAAEDAVVVESHVDPSTTAVQQAAHFYLTTGYQHIPANQLPSSILGYSPSGLNAAATTKHGRVGAKSHAVRAGSNSN